MKTTQNKFIKICNSIIAGLMAILGFAYSCSPDEYGTPSAKFIVNGKVTSSESEQPIEGVRVIMQRDTILTDNEGNYQVSDRCGFPSGQSYIIQFQDIDNETNGQYNDLDTIVEFNEPQFTGGDGDWYNGETSKQFDVKLTPKK